MRILEGLHLCYQTHIHFIPFWSWLTSTFAISRIQEGKPFFVRINRFFILHYPVFVQ